MKTKGILCAILAVTLIFMLASCGKELDGSVGDNGNIGDSVGEDVNNGDSNGDDGNGNSDDSNADGNNTDSIGDADSNVSSGDENSSVDAGGDSDAGKTENDVAVSDTNNNSDATNGGNNSDNSSNNSNSNSNNSSSGNTDGKGSKLTGTPEEVLETLISSIQGAGVQMPMSLPPTAVVPEFSQNAFGLSEADFNKLVVSAADSLAAISTFAHQIVVIKAKDAKSAEEVKKLISGNNGYDVKKWICVWPQKAAVVDSGEYVLLVASNGEVVDAAIKTFEKEAVNLGAVDVFWEDSGGDIESGGFGGIELTGIEPAGN